MRMSNMLCIVEEYEIKSKNLRNIRLRSEF